MNQPDIEPLAAPPADEIQRAQAQRLEKTWETPSGFRYWSSVNNSDVGLWYTGMTLFFLLYGGVLALLMRIQLAVPNNDFLSAELYNQAFTVHGSVMMFLFAIPIFEAIAVLFLAPAANLDVSIRHWRRHLAAGLFIYRNCCDRRRR